MAYISHNIPCILYYDAYSILNLFPMMLQPNACHSLSVPCSEVCIRTSNIHLDLRCPVWPSIFRSILSAALTISSSITQPFPCQHFCSLSTKQSCGCPRVFPSFCLYCNCLHPLGDAHVTFLYLCSQSVWPVQGHIQGWRGSCILDVMGKALGRGGGGGGGGSQSLISVAACTSAGYIP